MKQKIEELNKLLEMINEIKMCFFDIPMSREEEFYYYNERNFRRVFDVIGLILAGENDSYGLPPLENHHSEFYQPPGLVDAFHRSLMEGELKKYGWQLEIMELEEGWNVEELPCFLAQVVKDAIDSIPNESFLEYPLFDEQCYVETSMLCIILENRELAEKYKALKEQERKEVRRYLSYMGNIHDNALGIGEELTEDAVRICVIVPPEIATHDSYYDSLNMYYSTPEAVLAARIINELCQAV